MRKRTVRLFRNLRVRMVARFAALSAIVFVAVGLGLHWMAVDFVTDYFRGTAEFHAQFVADTLVAPHLVQAAGGGDAELTEVLRGDALAGDMLAVRVWRADGTLLAADRSIAGAVPASRAQLDGALDTGAYSGPVAPPTPVDARAHPDVDAVLTTFVTVPGPPPFVVELVQDWRPTTAAASEFSRTLDLALAVGLAALWALLLPIVHRTGGRLEDQTSLLADQGAELERLLQIEQHTTTRLKELHDLKDAFITAVSHELRTPLTVVLGVARTMRAHDGQMADGMRRRLLDSAVHSGERLESLLTAMLDLNPGTQEWRRTVPERLDLQVMTAEVLRHLPEREVDTALDSRHVVADAVQLDCIVSNLIGNAMRHTPDDASILVWSRRQDDGVVLGVDDDGPGVPDALKADIFEAFTQGAITDAHSPGTGIGLSLVRRFAELHGGKAWVQDAPTGGASFRVHLPQPPSIGRIDDPTEETRRVAGSEHEAPRPPANERSELWYAQSGTTPSSPKATTRSSSKATTTSPASP